MIISFGLLTMLFVGFIALGKEDNSNESVVIYILVPLVIFGVK